MANSFKNCFILLFLVTIGLTAQDAPPKFIADSLDLYIEDAMKDWQIPGMAVAIIKDGKIEKIATYGVKDLKTNDPVDENSLFMIGSNTKAFTGILMATLATNGVFSLEDPIVKWLPNFKMKDEWIGKHLTIADGLSHRAGFQTFQGDFMVFDSDLTPNQIIEKYSKIEPVHSFRTTWGYFNTGYMLAGEVVKASTGKTWGQMIQDSIFTPLGMNNSLALSKEISNAKNATKAHTYENGKIIEIAYGDIDLVAPAGSISSSISDMATWVKVLLNNGVLDAQTVINPKAINATIQPYSIMGNGGHPFNTSHFALYGLGWDLMDYEGYKIIAHTGGIHGYVTSVTTVPEENLGVVVLTNTDANYFFEGLKWDIVDAYLGLKRNNYHKPYYGYFLASKKREKEQIEAWKAKAAENPETSVPLKKFAGTYKSEVYGSIQLSLEGDTLNATFEHHPQLKASLAHIGEDEFMANYNHPLYGVSVFPFTTKDEKVESFVLKLPDFIEATTYDFVKVK